MKEATGELNMTVIAILIIAAIGGIALWILNEKTFRDAIKERFTDAVKNKDNTYTEGETPSL